MKSSRKLGLSVKCQNLGHEVTNTWSVALEERCPRSVGCRSCLVRVLSALRRATINTALTLPSNTTGYRLESYQEQQPALSPYYTSNTAPSALLAASWVEHALSHWRPCLGRCISWNSEVTKLHNAILSGPPHTHIVSQVQIQIQRQVFLRHTLDKMRVWTHHPHHWRVIRLIQCWPIPMIPIITKLQATKLHNGTPHRGRGSRDTIVEIQMQVKNNYIFQFKCTFIKFGIISWASWLESLSEVLLRKRCHWGPSAL